MQVGHSNAIGVGLTLVEKLSPSYYFLAKGFLLKIVIQLHFMDEFGSAFYNTV